MGKNPNMPDARAQAGFVAGDGRFHVLKGSGSDQVSNLNRYKCFIDLLQLLEMTTIVWVGYQTLDFPGFGCTTLESRTAQEKSLHQIWRLETVEFIRLFTILPFL